MSGSSSFRRGPKRARYRRPDNGSPRTSSGSVSPTNRRIGSRSTSTRSSAESTTTVTTATSTASSTGTDCSDLSKASISTEFSVVAPEMTIEPGDQKLVYHLEDKGKLVIIHRKCGDLLYMLRCVDGRRIYVEKTEQGASLIMTNRKGKVVRALAGEY